MKNNGKLLVSFILIAVLSATLGVGVYSYFSNKNQSVVYDGSAFDQSGYYPVSYTMAAENIDFTVAADQSIHAVVHIKSVAKPSSQRQQTINPFDFLFGFGATPQLNQPRIGFGSGVIISRDGYIVTNNHVIEKADEIEVTTNDGEIYTAKLIGGDEASDIALLKIEGKDFPVIPFGNSEELKVGEWVLAVGNPFNLKSTVTAGIVSAKGRGEIFSNPYGRNRTIEDKIQSYIQTDAAVNPGNSGGALVNTRGELVGINTAIYSETGNFVGYSFAVPITIVKKVVTDIKEHGVVQRALLGVSVMSLEDLRQMDKAAFDKLKVKDGVYVGSFSSKSSAEKAGMKIGDVITAINGQSIRNYNELRAQTSLYSPGQKIEVEVNRYGETKTYTVELKNDQGTTEPIKLLKAQDVLGAKMKELSDKKRDGFGINYGVEIESLDNGKLKSAGIEEGFIILTLNRTRVSTPNDVESIVDSVLKQDVDDRGLFIRGCYADGEIIYFAIDLSN
ncbi:trypsin-like peptidase domain-containing protein [Bacteroidales bacterium OttesenSCG-928-M11]|nr:trypsin-like peptidase domain-containing protein [Bacteroidales bacterium OttesenSCG-928-M11]